MTVTSPVSLSKIITEFGSGGAPKNLGAYVRGGAYVPNTPANAAVATTAAALKLSQFVGATKYTAVSITSANDSTVLVPGEGTYRPPPNTCAATGGSGTLTYSLSVVNAGSTGTIQLESQSGHMAQFKVVSFSSGGVNDTATWKWTVTDGTTSDTKTFTVTAFT